jgi:hypothetical protein
MDRLDLMKHFHFLGYAASKGCVIRERHILDMMWKESVMISFQVQSGDSPEPNEVNHKNNHFAEPNILAKNAVLEQTEYEAIALTTAQRIS